MRPISGQCLALSKSDFSVALRAMLVLLGVSFFVLCVSAEAQQTKKFHELDF